MVDQLFNFLDGLRMSQGVLRKLVGRGVEIVLLHPNHHIGLGSNEPDEPLSSVIVHPEFPNIYSWFECEITNHTDQKLRIIGATLQLKSRHWFFGEKTIATATMKRMTGRPSNTQAIWSLEMEPITGPQHLNLIGQDAVAYPLNKLPKRMFLQVEFNLVGSRRRIVRRIKDYKHDPKTLNGLL